MNSVRRREFEARDLLPTDRTQGPLAQHYRFAKASIPEVGGTGTKRDRSSASIEIVYAYSCVRRHTDILTIYYPDRLLGLDGDRTYRGLYWNLTPGEHHSNLFNLIDNAAIAIAIATLAAQDYWPQQAA